MAVCLDGTIVTDVAWITLYGSDITAAISNPDLHREVNDPDEIQKVLAYHKVQDINDVSGLVSFNRYVVDTHSISRTTRNTDVAEATESLLHDLSLAIDGCSSYNTAGDRTGVSCYFYSEYSLETTLMHLHYEENVQEKENRIRELIGGAVEKSRAEYQTPIVTVTSAQTQEPLFIMHA